MCSEKPEVELSTSSDHIISLLKFLTMMSECDKPEEEKIFTKENSVATKPVAPKNVFPKNDECTAVLVRGIVEKVTQAAQTGETITEDSFFVPPDQLAPWITKQVVRDYIINKCADNKLTHLSAKDAKEIKLLFGNSPNPQLANSIFSFLKKKFDNQLGFSSLFSIAGKSEEDKEVHKHIVNTVLGNKKVICGSNPSTVEFSGDSHSGFLLETAKFLEIMKSCPQDLVTKGINTQAQISANISRQEDNLQDAISKVTMEMIKIGVAGVGASASIQMLQTYIDLVQKALAQMEEIRMAESTTRKMINDVYGIIVVVVG